MARELVGKHGMTQAKVAKLFGVTDAAISQYLKNKRGDSSHIDNSEGYGRFKEEVAESARLIAEEASDMSAELCRICKVIKNIGILADVYEVNTGVKAPKCAWGDAAVQSDIRSL